MIRVNEAGYHDLVKEDGGSVDRCVDRFLDRLT